MYVYSSFHSPPQTTCTPCHNAVWAWRLSNEVTRVLIFSTNILDGLDVVENDKWW